MFCIIMTEWMVCYCLQDDVGYSEVFLEEQPCVENEVSISGLSVRHCRVNSL